VSNPPQQSLYGDNRRPDVAPHLPDGVASVLDVGCGRGGFGATLRERYGSAARVVGVEPVAGQAERARAGEGFDEVIDGYFPGALAARPERFDLVTFNDVLEHMVDPWEALRACHDVLTPRGRVLAAIPNIAYAPAVWDLVRGRWEYTDDGILDRTHLRFFTRDSMVGLLESTGYVVEACVGANSIGRVWERDPVAPRRWAKLVLERGLRDHRWLHFVLVGRPARPPR
jgi:SAM-dependent methyltransferase